jgi:hypothetical protein
MSVAVVGCVRAGGGHAIVAASLQLRRSNERDPSKRGRRHEEASAYPASSRGGPCPSTRLSMPWGSASPRAALTGRAIAQAPERGSASWSCRRQPRRWSSESPLRSARASRRPRCSSAALRALVRRRSRRSRCYSGSTSTAASRRRGCELRGARRLGSSSAPAEPLRPGATRRSVGVGRISEAASPTTRLSPTS